MGWPPIGTYRSKTRATTQPRSPLYVKVNMDGVPIGRKVDLNAHDSYETLALALEDMFQRPNNANGELFGHLVCFLKVSPLSLFC